MYVKLNTLEMVHDLRLQLQQQFGQNQIKTLNKATLSEERTPQEEERTRRKRKSRLGLDAIEKIKEKFKQTFVKKDVFIKEKKKTEKAEKAEKVETAVEFNDQAIFTNNSTGISKKFRGSHSVHSKLQILRSPNKRARLELI